MSVLDVEMYCPKCGKKMKARSGSEATERFEVYLECECGKAYSLIVDDNGTKMVWR